MRLRMLIALTGTHDGLPWPPVGGHVEVAHPGTVDDLVRNGYAEIVPEPKPKLQATATIETVEAPARPFTAAKRTGKTKPRSSP